eukprot:scaffold202129_cov37-Prasinocladus_malaysianus.AAC.1
MAQGNEVLAVASDVNGEQRPLCQHLLRGKKIPLTLIETLNHIKVCVTMPSERMFKIARWD